MRYLAGRQAVEAAAIRALGVKTGFGTSRSPRNYYREDILKLAQMLDRDLSAWMR